MNLKLKKSGQNKKTHKSFSTRWHEFLDKIGKHFSTVFVGRLKNAQEVRLWVVEWALLVLVLFLFSIVQIFWYSDTYETEAYVRGGDFSEATLGKINSMNPLYAANSSEKTLAKLLFANLVSPDASGHQKAELAKSVVMDESGKVWTVTLRDNIYWSDGEPIVADDIIYTVGLINDSSAKTTVSVSFTNVELEKIDDKTVKFTLPSVYVEFLDNLEFPLLPSHILKDINPALVYENNFSLNPVSSGVFTLNAMQTSAIGESNLQTVYLNRSENYFLDDAMLYSFTLKTYEKTSDIITAIKASDVQATAELGVEDAAELPNSIGERTSLTNGGVYAFLNTKSGVLSNAKVRQAIQRGVDIEAVRGEGMDDSQKLDYPILSDQFELDLPEIAAYDMDAAKKLLEESKLKYDGNKLVDADGEEVALTIAVVKRDTITKAAERFAEELKKMGFEVTLSIFDESQVGADFFATVVRPRDYDILIYEIDLGVSADPFVYYSSTQASGSGWNFSNYSNNLVDDALLSAHVTTNMNLKKTKYESFVKNWVNDVPAIGIYRSSMKYYYTHGARIYSEDVKLTDALDRFVDVRYWASEKSKVNMTP